MKMRNQFLLVAILALASCKHGNKHEKSNDEVVKETLATVPGDTAITIKIPVDTVPASPAPIITVSARMIYKDGTLSSFDVLNDKTKALSNVIIGGGDAENWSEKTRFLLKGSADSINILIKQGKYGKIERKDISIRDSLVLVMNDTGCEEITVDVKRGKTSIYNGVIKYHCQE